MEQQRDIVSNVMRVARKVRRLERPDRNESRGSLRLLRKLADHDGLTARELAEMMDIRQPSLTEMLKRLEGCGIVRREADQQDHRKVRIYLQDEGREILERYREQRQQEVEYLNSVLTQEEQQLFCGICDKMADALEELRRKAGD